MVKHDAKLSHLSFVATQAVLLAGDILRKGFGTSFKVSSKTDYHDMVTEFDAAAENAIISTIREHFPAHSLLAEESGKLLMAQAPITWVIDPLDGTTNFARNIPIFCVSIGAVDVHGQTLCGAVYQPLNGELFLAQRGHGAYLNGVRLHVSKTPRYKNALGSASVPYNFEGQPDLIHHFSRMAGLGNPIRSIGSAALSLAYIAAGRFDAFWGASLQPWDFVAGQLLVEEAGGRVSTQKGESCSPFEMGSLLATNGLIHDEMLAHF